MRLLLVASILVVGCVAADDVTSNTQSVVVNNRIAANRIAANRIAANRIAANRIAANRIAANRLTLTSAAGDLIETADGREVLTYIISCAIPEGTTLVGTDSNGITYEFFGEIGLAPQWEEHPLGRKGSLWVSACMFARVNNHDVAIPVSLRGPSAALATTADERANWSIEEGAFYGQLFLPISEPIAWFACSGRGAVEALGEERDCANPDPAHPGLTLCGFNYAGDCGDYTPPPSRTACKSQSSTGTFYRDCSDHPAYLDHHSGHMGGDGDDDDDHDGDDDDDHHGHDGHDNDHHGDHDHGLLVFHQVITTYVHP